MGDETLDFVVEPRARAHRPPVEHSTQVGYRVAEVEKPAPPRQQLDGKVWFPDPSFRFGLSSSAPTQMAVAPATWQVGAGCPEPPVELDGVSTAIDSPAPTHPHDVLPQRRSDRTILIALITTATVALITVSAAFSYSGGSAAQHRAEVALARALATPVRPATSAATAPPSETAVAPPPAPAAQVAVAPKPAAVVVPAAARAAPRPAPKTATPTPAPTPVPTQVPTPTPPVLVHDAGSGYLSTNAALASCSKGSGFTSAATSGPDGFARACTFTFSVTNAGAIAATLSSTGVPPSATPVSQQYCILLYAATGTTPLTQSCLTGTSASLSANSASLTPKTGVFRIEVEAKSTKTTFSLALSHY